MGSNFPQTLRCVFSQRFVWLGIVLVLMLAVWGVFFWQSAPWVGVFLLIFLGVMVTNLWYRRRILKRLHFFYASLRYEDYSVRFQTHSGSRWNRELNRLLNEHQGLLSQSRQNMERRELYYAKILEQVRSGIVLLDEHGFVRQVNPEALRLLRLQVFTHVKQLGRVDSELALVFQNLQAGQEYRVSCTDERGRTELWLQTSSVEIADQTHLLVLIQDLWKEVDSQEVDSWIKIIRVMSHEILNSVSPITALSGDLVDCQRRRVEEAVSAGVDAHVLSDLSSDLMALETINDTSAGLLRFVDAYRQFTRLPTPHLELFGVDDFVRKIALLSRSIEGFEGVCFRTEVCTQDAEFEGDPNLLGQVLFNLIRNSLQALADREGGRICLRVSGTNAGGCRSIQILDNGPGVPSNIQEDIFLPFFTTRSGGSGVGLAVGRQILKAHGGHLFLRSSLRETVFELLY